MSEEYKPKPFQEIPAEMANDCLIKGLEIYRMTAITCTYTELYEKDYILNSLCASLYFFICNNVKKDDHHEMIQIIYKILTKNVDANLDKNL